MGKSYKQSKDSQDCFRIKNRFPGRALTHQTPSPGKNVKGGGPSDRRGSESYVGERCRSKGQGNERPISKQLVSSVKIGRWKQTSHKLKESELYNPILTLQNGGFESFERPVTRERFHVQNIFKRCIFLCSPSPRTSEIHLIQMGGPALRVLMSMFWSGSSSSNIHETPENPCSNFKEKKHLYNCLPRRFSPDEPDNRGFRNGQGHIDFPISTIRIFDKPKEICFDSSSVNRVFGLNDRLSDNVIEFARKESSELRVKMSKFDSESPNNCGGGSKFNRFPVLNSSSCTANFSSDEIYTATTHFCTETKSESSGTVLLKRELYQGTGLVGEESRAIEWQGNHNLRDQGGYPDRCLKEDNRHSRRALYTYMC